MNTVKIKVEHWSRLFLILFVVLKSILTYGQSSMENYVFLLLLFILNSQLRIHFFKNKLLLLSIFTDLLLLYWLHTQFNDVSVFLLLITFIDVLLALDEEIYLLSFIISILLVYFIKDQGYMLIFLSLILYLFIFLFIHQTKKFRGNLTEIEFLYDDNRKYSYELEESKKQLKEFAKMVEHVSSLQERNRISRELHDDIGHKLTGVLMQLDACIRIFEVDETKGRNMMHSVRDNLSQCIDLLRKTVKNIKPQDNPHKIEAIKQMANDFSNTSGVNIEFRISGDAQTLYPSIELALYKNAQEAITNAVRHGKSKNIYVSLEYFSNHVELTVEDDGLGCSSFSKGMGLTGMEERIEVLGGKLSVDIKNRFKLRTMIPIKQGEKNYVYKCVNR